MAAYRRLPCIFCHCALPRHNIGSLLSTLSRSLHIPRRLCFSMQQLLSSALVSPPGQSTPLAWYWQHNLTYGSSYLIIIKGLMPSVVASIYHDLTSPDTNPPAWALKGTNWLLIFMLVLVPLCFLRRLDSLRHTSFIGLFAASELMISFMAHGLISLDSLHDRHCHLLLLPTLGGHATPWRNTSHSFYP